MYDLDKKSETDVPDATSKPLEPAESNTGLTGTLAPVDENSAIPPVSPTVQPSQPPEAQPSQEQNMPQSQQPQEADPGQNSVLPSTPGSLAGDNQFTRHEEKPKSKVFLYSIIIFILVLGAAAAYWFLWPTLIGKINPTSANKVALSSSVYGHETANFEIIPPKNWSVNSYNGTGVYAVFTNPVTDTDGTNAFNANLNVTIQELTESTSLGELIENTKTQLGQILSNYKVVSERSTTIKGLDGYLLSGSFSQGEYNLRNVQLIIINQTKMYVVTGTALQSAWGKYNDVFDSSMRTFELKN